MITTFPNDETLNHRLRRVSTRVPVGAYHVDAEALRQARQSTPRGEYHA